MTGILVLLFLLLAGQSGVLIWALVSFLAFVRQTRNLPMENKEDKA